MCLQDFESEAQFYKSEKYKFWCTIFNFILSFGLNSLN